MPARDLPRFRGSCCVRGSCRTPVVCVPGLGRQSASQCVTQHCTGRHAGTGRGCVHPGTCACRDPHSYYRVMPCCLRHGRPFLSNTIDVVLTPVCIQPVGDRNKQAPRLLWITAGHVSSQASGRVTGTPQDGLCARVRAARSSRVLTVQPVPASAIGVSVSEVGHSPHDHVTRQCVQVPTATSQQHVAVFSPIVASYSAVSAQFRLYLSSCGFPTVSGVSGRSS